MITNVRHFMFEKKDVDGWVGEGSNFFFISF